MGGLTNDRAEKKFQFQNKQKREQMVGMSDLSSSCPDSKIGSGRGKKKSIYSSLDSRLSRDSGVSFEVSASVDWSALILSFDRLGFGHPHTWRIQRDI